MNLGKGPLSSTWKHLFDINWAQSSQYHATATLNIWR